MARQVDKSKEIFISSKNELEHYITDFRFTTPIFARVSNKIKNLPYFVGTIADKEIYWSGDLEDLNKYHKEISEKQIKEIIVPEHNYKLIIFLVGLSYVLGVATTYFIIYG